VGPRGEATTQNRTHLVLSPSFDGLSCIGKILKDEDTFPGGLEKCVRRPMEEGSDAVVFPPSIAAEDGPPMSQVLVHVTLDGLTFEGHSLLNSGDRSQVDSAEVPVGGGDVGGVEVEIDPGVRGRGRYGMRNPEVKQKCSRSQREAEVPPRGLSILSKEGVRDGREVDDDVGARTDRDVEPTGLETPSGQIATQTGLQATSMG
jgi:hypothetical protein